MAHAVLMDATKDDATSFVALYKTWKHVLGLLKTIIGPIRLVSNRTDKGRFVELVVNQPTIVIVRPARSVVPIAPPHEAVYFAVNGKTRV